MCSARSTAGVRAWRHAVLLCCALLCAIGIAAASERPFSIDADNPWLHWRAELAIVDSATPPPADSDWRAVQLPESWRPAERYRQGINGWYRFKLQGPAPAEPHSVYLWRFSMNAAVYFNGEWVGDGGSFDEPIARNWNRPLIFRLPAAMWRDGENQLHVRLRVYPGFGHMTPVAVGPTRLLQPDYERRYFAQITGSQVAAVVMLIAMLTGLALWLIERKDTAYLYFTGVTAAWLAYAINKFVQDVPLPAERWWWLLHTAIDVPFLLMPAFMHRVVGVRRPRLERTMLAVFAVFAVLYAWWELPQLARFNPITHGIASLAGFYLLGWLMLRWVRRPTFEAGLYALLMCALMAAAVYDLLLNSLLIPALWRGGFYLLYFTMPALLLVMACLLALRAARAAQALRVANETLEARVQQASEQIEAQYARERRLLADQSAAQERERIYRDLHDNLGARLLSLVYGAGDERQRTLARDALSEMRTIVATTQLDAGQLADLAEEWRLEAELRCENAGHELVWTRDGDARLAGRQRYQLERICRELISNAIEHGRGQRVEVSWSVVAQRLELRVADDGCGMPAGGSAAGVLARAADLQGSASWQPNDGGGTLVVVSLPIGVPQSVATT